MVSTGANFGAISSRLLEEVDRGQTSMGTSNFFRDGTPALSALTAKDFQKYRLSSHITQGLSCLTSYSFRNACSWAPFICFACTSSLFFSLAHEQPRVKSNCCRFTQNGPRVVEAWSNSVGNAPDVVGRAPVQPEIGRHVVAAAGCG